MMATALTLTACAQSDDQMSNEFADPGLPGGNAFAGGPSRVGIIPGVALDQDALIDACLAGDDQHRRLANFSRQERARFVACLSREMAAQVKPQLPIRIDPATTITAFDADGLNVSYAYTVDVDGRPVPPGAMEQVKITARATACANPQMRQGLEVGSTYLFRWADKDGRSLGELRVDHC